MEFKNNQEKTNFWFLKINTYLLAALMLYSGISKLFVTGVEGVSNMLSSFGFFLPLFFAWLLIIVELGSGIMLFIGKYKRIVVIFPAIIMLIAAFFILWTNLLFLNPIWSSFIQHIILATNYLLVGYISYK